MDVIESVEQTFRQAAPILLAGPGILLVLSGLFLWPGGLRFLKPLAVFFASAAGLVCAWVLTDRSLTAMLLLGLLPALAALVLDKPVVVLLGAALAAGVVAGLPLATDASFRGAVAERVPAMPAAEQMSILETPEYAERLTAWAGQWIGAFWAETPMVRKAASAGAAAVVLLLGAVAWRWVCALTCATLGTAMILSGTLLLLLSKGPQTMPYIQDKLSYAGLIAGVMLATGTLLNRWLCPAAVKAVPKKTERHSDKGDEK